MNATRIHLRKKSCEGCDIPFKTGDIIYHFDNDEKNYCADCSSKELSDSHLDSSYTLYVAHEGPRDLMTGKLILNRSSFNKLDNEIYTLEQLNQLITLNLAGINDRFSDSFSRSTVESEYVFEKNNANALLLFSPKDVLSKYDFFDRLKDYEFISSYFTHIGKRSFLVCDQDDRVVGLSNTQFGKFKLVRSHFPYTVTTFMSMEDLNNQYKSNTLNWHIHRAINRLSPQAMLSYCENRIQGQGIQLKLAVYQIYRYMQNAAGEKNFQAENWILTAPSGSGKTEFYRTIRDLFTLYNIPIPVVQIDLSQITETGYKGNNVSTIPQRILAEKPDAGGIAICFLDEADKKCIPSYGSRGTDNNAAVQANLLTLIEGSHLKVEMDDEQKDFDSNHTMFVLMGAFQSIRQQKQEKRKTRPLGFGTEYGQTTVKDDIDQVEDGFFDDLSLQDMIDFGMREELAGRMVQVVNFHRLSEKAMLELIKYKTKEISDSMEISIEMTENAARDFLAISFGSLGVRRPINMIKELVQNTVAEVFFEGKFDSKKDKVVIESMDTAHIAPLDS